MNFIDALQAGRMLAAAHKEGVRGRPVISIYDGYVEAYLSEGQARQLHQWLGRALAPPPAPEVVPCQPMQKTATVCGQCGDLNCEDHF